MKFKGIAAITLVGALAISGLATAHGSATGVVKDRMDVMTAIAANMKSVGGMVSGKTSLDRSAISQAMGEIAENAKRLAHMFPEGTGEAPSEAAPTVWSDREGFQALLDELEKSTRSMSELAASDGDSDLGTAFRLVAVTCKNCHKDYRINRD